MDHQLQNLKLVAISGLVAEKHSLGIIRYIFGAREMGRRIRSLAIRYNNDDRSTPNAFRDAVAASYLDHDRLAPSILHIPNAISYVARVGHPSSAHVYQSDTDRQWFVPDVASPDLHRFVRLEPPVAYAQRSTSRADYVRDIIDPLPFWAIPSTGTMGTVGVPVKTRTTEVLMYGKKSFLTADGKARSTVNVQFKWPGYSREFKAQIRIKSDAKDCGSGTYQRLVNLVKGSVRNFIDAYAQEPCQNAHWAVGPGRITADDLVLVAVVVVSQGAVMPILKVTRDNFVVPPNPIQGQEVAAATVQGFGSYGTFGGTFGCANPEWMNVEY
ncbi:unnamed protein product [Peniophora sp. CBMAI 1063]|nr:unnamed protein product [Peniophora sp. CBMAI 1063]